MALIQTGDFPDVLDLSIQDIWGKIKPQTEEFSREFYFYDDVSDFTVKDSSVSGYTGWAQDAEGGESLAVDQYQGLDKSYSIVRHSAFLRLTEKMQLAFKARDIADQVEDLKVSGIRYKEKVLHNVLNNSTSTSYTETNGARNFTHTNTGGASVSPQSTAITREDSGTNNTNKIVMGSTNNPDFAYDSLKAAHTIAQAIKGPVGEEWDLDPDILVCKKKSSVSFEAMEILKNLETGGPRTKPDVTSNSGAANLPFRLVETPYITSDTFWAMFDSRNINKKTGLQFKELMPMTPRPESVRVENGEIRNAIRTWFQYGFNDLGRAAVISLGTNT